MKKYCSGFFFSRHPRQTGSRQHLFKAIGLRGCFLDLIVLPAFFLLIFILAVSTGPAMAATEGSSNNFFGDGAGDSTTGNDNSFFGGNSGHANSSGYDNSFFGLEAGYLNTTGHTNCFFGYQVGYDNTSGDTNSFFGANAGENNTSGYANSFFGYKSGSHHTSGYSNSFFGVFAGINDSYGHSNSFFGRDAGYLNTTGDYNTSLGYHAGFNNGEENYNTFVGSYTNLNPGSDPATNPVTNATAIGYRAYVSQSNSLVLGSIKGVNSATDNVNVGIGISAPARQLHLKGDNAVFRMDRSTDTAAFMIVRTNLAGTAVLKTFVVGTNASGSNDGEFVINDLGNAVGGPGTRRMTIDNYGDAEFTGSVTATGFYPSSSIALKTNVRTYGNALQTVKQLRGVRFDWKGSGKPSVGLIAEEVEGVVPEVVSHGGKSGEVTGLNYDSLVGVLVEAVKEQQAELAGLRAEVQQLKALLQGK